MEYLPREFINYVFKVRKLIGWRDSDRCQLWNACIEVHGSFPQNSFCRNMDLRQEIRIGNYLNKIESPAKQVLTSAMPESSSKAQYHLWTFQWNKSNRTGNPEKIIDTIMKFECQVVSRKCQLISILAMETLSKRKQTLIPSLPHRSWYIMPSKHGLAIFAVHKFFQTQYDGFLHIHILCWN